MLENLGKYVGASCEIRTMANDLLQRCKIKQVRWEKDTPTLVLVHATGGDLSVLRLGTPIKLSLRAPSLPAAVIGGQVFIANRDFWHVMHLEEFASFERRRFFRINCSGEGTAVKLSDGVDAKPMSVSLVDISLSGIRFATEEVFEMEERLFLAFQLGNDPFPYELDVIVKKIIEGTNRGNHYGCDYLEMKESDSDRLCKVIFDLEREAQKKRTGM